MATNSNITVSQNYATKYSNLVHGWDTSHPTTISKKFIILIYHYLHAVIRALQIHKMKAHRKQAASTNKKQRVAAAEGHAIRNARRLIAGDYNPGEFVIVALKGPGIVRGQGMPKEADTWAGPLTMVRRFKTGWYA